MHHIVKEQLFTDIFQNIKKNLISLMLLLLKPGLAKMVVEPSNMNIPSRLQWLPPATSGRSRLLMQKNTSSFSKNPFNQI